MKRKFSTLLPAIALLLGAFQFSACSKKDDTPSAGSLAQGKCMVTATISGAHTADYKSSEMMSMVLKQGFISINSANSGALSGNPSLAEQFIIYLPLDVTAGTHNSEDFPSSNPATFTYTYTNGSDASGWTAGANESSVNFTITKTTTEKIEGTFEGTMAEEENNTQVTVKGKFAARY